MTETNESAKLEDIDLEFYCPKCYDTLTACMDDSLGYALKATKYKLLFEKCKVRKDEYSRKLHDLDFEHNESKALIEELEEKLQTSETLNRTYLDELKLLRDELEALKSSKIEAKPEPVNVELISFDDEVVPIQQTKLECHYTENGAQKEFIQYEEKKIEEANLIELESQQQQMCERIQDTEAQLTQTNEKLEHEKIISNEQSIQIEQLQSRLSVLESELSRLREENEHLKTDVESNKHLNEQQSIDYQSKLSELSSQVDMFKSQSDELRKKLEVAADTESSIRVETSSLMNQLNQSNDCISQLRVRISELEAELNQKSRELDSKLDEIKANWEEIEKLRSQLRPCNDDEMMGQFVNSKEQNMSKQLFELKRHIDDQYNVIEDNLKRISHLESELNRFRDDHSKLSDENGSLKAEIVSKTQHIDCQQRTFEDSISQLNSTNEELNLEKKNLEGSLESVRAQLDQSSEKICELEAALSRKDAELVQLESQLRMLSAQLAAANCELETLQRDLVDAHTKLRSAQSELERHDELTESLRTEFELQQMEQADAMARLGAELDAYRNKCAELDAYRGKCAELRQFITGCEEQFTQTRELNKSLLAENERLKASVNKEQQTLSTYLDQIQSLTDALHENTNELEELRRRDQRQQALIDAKTTQLGDADEKIRRAHELAAQLEAENDRLKVEFEAEMRAESKKHVDENYRLKKELNQTRDELTAQIATLNDEMRRKVDDLEMQNSTAKASFEKRRHELESRIESLESDISVERQQCRDYKRQIAVLESQIDELKACMIDERCQTEHYRKEMSGEMSILAVQLETSRSNEAVLGAEKNRLMDEIAAFHRDFADLQAKFCEAIVEKQCLLNEIVELNKSHAATRKRAPDANFNANDVLEFQVKIEEKLEQMNAKLEKTKRMSGQFRSTMTSSIGETTFLVNKIDERMENKLEIKLNEKIEEANRQKVEIQNLKHENSKLIKERKTLREEIKQLKDTNKQHENNMAKLNDEIHILKDTIEYLQDQVKDLNEQISALINNKENVNNDESLTTAADKKTSDSFYHRSLIIEPKKCLNTELSSPPLMQSIINPKHNLAAEVSSSSSPSATASKSSPSPKTTPTTQSNLNTVTTAAAAATETPSSTIRQRQCAQQ